MLKNLWTGAEIDWKTCRLYRARACSMRFGGRRRVSRPVLSSAAIVRATIRRGAAA